VREENAGSEHKKGRGSHITIETAELGKIGTGNVTIPGGNGNNLLPPSNPNLSERKRGRWARSEWRSKFDVWGLASIRPYLEQKHTD